MMNERLSSIMTKNIVTVNTDANLATVKEILFSRGFHHIPVVDNGKLKGIITSYDLMKLNKKFEEYAAVSVKDVMKKKVVTLGPNELIGAAAQIFLKHLFHGLPIVDDNGDLVGIVTTHDILKYEFKKEYPEDAFVRDTNWLETVTY